MDSEDKQRISLYLDKETVAKMDGFIKQSGYRSRNDFVSSAVDNLIADELLGENDTAISEKLARAVADLSDDNAKAISKGLFRYAVQLEMVMRMIAEQFEYEESEIENMRREAINNVRRTRGKVRLDEILKGYYNG